MEPRKLRGLRAEQEPKVTQGRLARSAGMSTSRYWQIENGEGPEPTDVEKAAIATQLGVAVSDIEWPLVAQRASAS